MLHILNSREEDETYWGTMASGNSMCMFKAAIDIAATCSKGSIFHRHQQLRLHCQVPTEIAMSVPTAVLGAGHHEDGCASIATTGSR